MEFILIGAVALLASLLTFFSGFGLGTMLLPAFALFFPLEYAIALTGVVHLLNNLFKTGLVGKYIDFKTLAIFGIPAIIGAFIGSMLQVQMGDLPNAYSYSAFDKLIDVSWTQVVVGLLLICFAYLENKKLSEKVSASSFLLPVGGSISGFFGGLSGHQGALRTAFLAQVNLSKESFIATGIAIACVVDLTRLPIYFSNTNEITEIPYAIMIVAVASAFAGAMIGKRFLKKISLKTLHTIIATLITVTGFAMLLGLF